MTAHGWTGAFAKLTAVAVLAAGWTLVSASAGEAQSRYACSGLEGVAEPVVEGEAGMFFRVKTDFLNDTRIAPRVVEEIAELSRAFDARGTRLIVVPLPTKGLVMPGALRYHATTVGFDHGLARALYEDMLARFQQSGVASVDAVEALADVDRPMFATDPRLTNDAIAALAAAVKGVLGARGGAPAFSATASGTTMVPSVVHQQIQSRCTLMLPPVETTAFDTVALTSGSDGADVVIAGSGSLAGEGLASEGLFAAALNRNVRHIVAEGAPLDALAALVADPAFAGAPPKAVVWSFPVTDDLAAFGLRPFREIAGMTRGACTPVSTGAVSGSTASSTFDVPANIDGSDMGIMVDLGAVPVSRLVLTLEREDEALRRRTIERRGDVRTTRFLMPLAGLGAATGDTIRIEVDDVLGPAPDVSLCEV